MGKHRRKRTHERTRFSLYSFSPSTRNLRSADSSVPRMRLTSTAPRKAHSSKCSAGHTPSTRVRTRSQSSKAATKSSSTKRNVETEVAKAGTIKTEVRKRKRKKTSKTRVITQPGGHEGEEVIFCNIGDSSELTPRIHEVTCKS